MKKQGSELKWKQSKNYYLVDVIRQYRFSTYKKLEKERIDQLKTLDTKD